MRHEETILDALARTVGPSGAILVDGEGRAQVVQGHDPEREFDPFEAVRARLGLAEIQPREVTP